MNDRTIPDGWNIRYVPRSSTIEATHALGGPGGRVVLAKIFSPGKTLESHGLRQDACGEVVAELLQRVYCGDS